MNLEQTLEDMRARERLTFADVHEVIDRAMAVAVRMNERVKEQKELVDRFCQVYESNTRRDFVEEKSGKRFYGQMRVVK